MICALLSRIFTSDLRLHDRTLTATATQFRGKSGRPSVSRDRAGPPHAATKSWIRLNGRARANRFGYSYFPSKQVISAGHFGRPRHAKFFRPQGETGHSLAPLIGSSAVEAREQDKTREEADTLI